MVMAAVTWLLLFIPPDQAAQVPAAQAGAQATISCASKPGERTDCPADTSSGVVLIRSTGQAPCLLGRTWGYEQKSVWVADGCSGEFFTGRATVPDTSKPSAPRHIPNVGFLLFDGEKGQIYFRLFSYGRYLNQRNLDETYVDAFGNVMTGLRAANIGVDHRLVVGGSMIGHARTFSAVGAGVAFWYANANGLCEIAVNRGRADVTLGVHIGLAVQVVGGRSS